MVCSAAKLSVNGEKPHMVISNVEHPCVANVAAMLEAEGKIGESAHEQIPFTLLFCHQTSWQMAELVGGGLDIHHTCIQYFNSLFENYRVD